MNPGINEPWLSYVKDETALLHELYFGVTSVILVVPVTVNESIESQAIRPATGEINNIDLWIVLS